MQARCDRPVEVRLELGPGDADFGAAETEGDKALRADAVVGGETCRLLGGFQARLAGDVEAPAQYGAELLLGLLAGVLDRVHERALLDAAAGRGERRDGQLGVADLLAGEFPGDLVGQEPYVLGGADQVHDAEVHVDEVGEVREGEVVDEGFGVGGDLGVGVAGGQFGHDAGEAEPTWWTWSSALGRPAMKVCRWSVVVMGASPCWAPGTVVRCGVAR